MTVPAYNEPFDPFYDLYSVRASSFSVPHHWNIYVPDYAEDFSCRSVIAPDRGRGASSWTTGGRWITIGVYRDEGRDAALALPRTEFTWTRRGTVLTVTDVGHRLSTGDRVALYGVNVEQLSSVTTTVTGVDTFTAVTPAYGGEAGTGTYYQALDPIDFYRDYCVFRLLPSFKLIHYSSVLQLFSETAPLQVLQERSFYNVTEGVVQAIPADVTASVNYKRAQVTDAQTSVSELSLRFDQVYDESGAPLPVSYNTVGQAVDPRRVTTPVDNEKRFVNQPFSGQDRVYVYDAYGIDLNAARGPYYATDVITRDATKDRVNPLDPILRDNIVYKTHNGVEIYSSTRKLFDNFGNIVIGIQENDALHVREPALPLSLDRFNRPTKSPIKR